MNKDSQLRGLGRRKTAIAQVELLPEEKSMNVNGKPFAEYFPTVEMQTVALSPLKLTSQDAMYGFRSKVSGGGKGSQADALKLALARALLMVDVNFRTQLKNANMLRRDARMRERKKPGLKRARRAPQFSKR